MTPQEEVEARKLWAEKRKIKSYARLGKMKEKQTMKMIPPAHRRWCVNTSRWYDDREGK